MRRFVAAIRSLLDRASGRRLTQESIETARREHALRLGGAARTMSHPALALEAFALFFDGHQAEGLALLELLTELHPESPDAWSDLAEARLLAGDTEGAAAASIELNRCMASREESGAVTAPLRPADLIVPAPPELLDQEHALDGERSAIERPVSR